VRRGFLLPLAAAVTGLLVLAGIASHGRPLEGGGSGGGPTARFFDYVFTTIVLVAAAGALVGLLAVSSLRPERKKTPRPRFYVAGAVLSIAGALLIAWLLSHSSFLDRLRGVEQRLQANQPAQQAPTRPAQPPPGARGARLRWDEIAIVLALLAGAGVLGFAVRSRSRQRPWAFGRERQEAVSHALDESLDDLLADPDLRRAIVAAYARMERALAAAGLPRRPAEAPLEYLERSLLELETSADAVRRLTDLFEWAKFSSHEPEPEMRDEAVAALAAVRDELRAPASPMLAGAAG
jgi:Domain of unknown function (DUF4129)